MLCMEIDFQLNVAPHHTHTHKEFLKLCVAEGAGNSQAKIPITTSLNFRFMFPLQDRVEEKDRVRRIKTDKSVRPEVKLGSWE